jgi:hypothetical protein
MTSLANMFLGYGIGFQLLGILGYHPDWSMESCTGDEGPRNPYEVSRADIDASDYVDSDATP